MATGIYIGRRLSFEGSLCTVRYIGDLDGAKGEWLGVEWDDPSRGKHDGKHKGEQIFECLSSSKTSASFIKSSRKPDVERTVLEAIRFKYGSGLTDDSSTTDVVIISGKVAEEVGFDKIAKEQAQLSELRVVLIDQLVVSGIAPRDASQTMIQQAVIELAETCPNVTELDLGWNTIEDWQDIACICSSLPKLRIIKTSGLRFRNFTHTIKPNPFAAIKELHLAECMLSLTQFCQIVSDDRGFPNLEVLFLSSNELHSLQSTRNQALPLIEGLKNLVLENNLFTNLDCIATSVALFPTLRSVSLQGNRISQIGLGQSDDVFPQIETLNVSYNTIGSFDFVDALPRRFPNLSALRITNNPLFLHNGLNTSNDPRASEKAYYLTLARIPSLTTLNYATISHRDREEGEMYYLSIAEKELKALFATTEEAHSTIVDAKRLYQRYENLIKKYGRDSIFDLYLSRNETSKHETTKAFTNSEPDYPIGSLGARLINAIFYLSNGESKAHPTAETKLQLPSSLPATRLMSILQRHTAFTSHLKPLQFKLIYESNELDPVDTTAESSTRSNIYGKNLSSEEKKAIWREWGDWNADSIVEREQQQQLHAPTQSGKNGTSAANGSSTTANDQAEHWIEGGKYCIKEGRRWKRREVEIPPALKRPWGDWIDNARDVMIRIEPIVAVPT